MQPQSIRPWWTTAILFSLFASWVSAHTVIVYPGWRGNNLHTTGTVFDTDGLGTAPASSDNDTLLYPYGQQWLYPCGGMPTSTNRTKWPVTGGAVSFQPGWFTGHETAFIYINLGLGTVPENMSLPMISSFQLVGPSKDPYPGTFCLPQVPLPGGIEVKVGDNATIQIVETAVHGAALYNCVDITFAEPEDVEEVTRTNCFNSSEITSRFVYSMNLDSSATTTLTTMGTTILLVPLLAAGYFGLL
ncbi:hypothetical protein AJ80_09544 [Polytolypa hystricis UAMH7299]|uniref:Copper acquisition factor BIM1-like domain-containing protein n=1 Tax=Polytolypa hystricis (strain UAMH7299) TaxID=1447883 RepID=A0A2B7WP35_POLH7|nr:hypothetical protein AJ80_09544 [Polytolypa hystricis UAMH7299]